MAFSFRTKLLASHAAVAVVAGAVVLTVVEQTLPERLEGQLDRRLEGQARAVAKWIQRARHYDALVGRLAGVVGARVQIIDERGVTVGDSAREPGADTTVLADTPELEAARAGEVGRATRYSERVGADVRYLAVPTVKGLVVRLGAPLDEVSETQSALRLELGLAQLIALGVAFALAVIIASALSRRLRETSVLAERIRGGDYDIESPSTSGDEVGVLAGTLSDAARQLGETEARRREFLANVAHELRTPVTSIRGYAETLTAAPVDDDTRTEFLDVIHRNAERIGHLVEDLLQLEALQHEDRLERIDDVTVAEIVDDVVDTLQTLVTGRGAAVDAEVPADLSVRGDPDAIERILQNLIENAVQHGGDGVVVRVRARPATRGAVIEVSDDGAGIAPEHLARIFERFYRGAAAGQRPGTGLGLAIARQLAEAMDGSLTARSEPGRGTTFALELPA